MGIKKSTLKRQSLSEVTGQIFSSLQRTVSTNVGAISE